MKLYQVWKGALHWREWIDRCGESLFFDAYRWAHEADPTALLCSSEADVLTTRTLTNAEAYHNLVYRLMDQGVPITVSTTRGGGTLPRRPSICLIEAKSASLM